MSQALTPETFKPLLAKLIKSPQSFTREDIVQSMEHLLDPASTMPSQVGSFLTALHINGLEHDSEILAGAAEVLRKHAILVEMKDTQGRGRTVDIVGTGGDGHDTFNVSTTAAVIAAGAGARVHKHGNRASTSSSGSADLLMALGCPFTPPRSTEPTPHPAFRFLLAPHYHPLLAPLAPIRRSIPHRTILNLIGPLVNPARPAGIVLGVANVNLGEVFVRALWMDKSVEHAMVVCGLENLDEISCAGDTKVWEFKRAKGDYDDGIVDGQTKPWTERIINAESFGLPSHHLSTVSGGRKPEENAVIFQQLLNPNFKPDDIPANPNSKPFSPLDSNALTPIRDFVLMNAAAVLVAADIASDLKEGVELARKSVESGAAWEALKAFRQWDSIDA